MKSFITLLLVFLCMATLSYADFPKTKSPMPNFYDGFGVSSPYPDAVYETEFGDEVVVLASSLHGKGLYITGTLNNAVLELTRQLIDFEDIKYVFFNSNGGYVSVGLEIGTLIRNNEIFTALDYESRCKSACFLAFIGGVERYQLGARMFTTRAEIVIHSPYYLDGPKKVYLERSDPMAEVVCEHIKKMLLGKGGERACFETFYAKEGTTHSQSLLHEMNVYSGYMQQYGYNFVDNYIPPSESEWYRNCFKTESDFELEMGSCERKAKQCTGDLCSDEYVSCMQKSGFKSYTKDIPLLSPAGSFTIRIQEKWEIMGRPKIFWTEKD